MEVKIYLGNPQNYKDERRIRDSTVLEKALLLNFPIQQIEAITFFQKTVRLGMAIENHYHPESSGRQEFFVILGKLSEEEKEISPQAVTFRFRKAGEPKIEQEMLRAGDACLVPAGYSHSFLPVRDGLCIICISNKPFSQGDEDAIPDKLF